MFGAILPRHELGGGSVPGRPFAHEYSASSAAFSSSSRNWKSSGDAKNGVVVSEDRTNRPIFRRSAVVVRQKLVPGRERKSERRKRETRAKKVSLISEKWIRSFRSCLVPRVGHVRRRAFAFGSVPGTRSSGRASLRQRFSPNLFGLRQTGKSGNSPPSSGPFHPSGKHP